MSELRETAMKLAVQYCATHPNAELLDVAEIILNFLKG